MLRTPLFAAAALALAGCSSHRAHPSSLPSSRPAPATSAASRPALPPLSQPIYSLSKVTEQTQPAHAVFASVTTRATFRDLQKAIQSAMTDLTAASSENAIQFVGPPIFIYQGATAGELDKPFTLEIGFPAAPGAKASEKVQIKPLPAMKSLAVSIEGPISAIDKAYDAIVPEAQKRKLRQTGEVREVYNRWEGGDSLHNQIVIAVGVE